MNCIAFKRKKTRQIHQYLVRTVFQLYLEKCIITIDGVKSFTYGYVIPERHQKTVSGLGNIYLRANKRHIISLRDIIQVFFALS